MLDSAILSQVRTVFEALDANYTFQVKADEQHESYNDLISFLEDLSQCSNRLNVEKLPASAGDLHFALLKDGVPTGISYRGIPGGHEFTSLLLAVLNADGKGKNLPDEGIVRRIQALHTPIQLQSYISLTCTNCPEVVQALQIISLYNKGITHELVDGALFQEEVDARKIQAVPTVFANGQQLSVGKADLALLLGKLEETFGSAPTQSDTIKEYDVVVLGGGPAGASASIYSARKGLKVAVVAERVGGQVKDTVGIENLVSVPYTTGTELADNLRTHMSKYPIDILEHRSIEAVNFGGAKKEIRVKGGETFVAPAVVIATGAGWRKLGVEGESKYIGRGVAFCPHCDGPFYAGKHVAVIGGGNSGVEAAIDLAGICSKVTLLEFGDALRADGVLQEKARSLSNVKIFTLSQTTEVIGDGEKVTGLRVKDRSTDEERIVNLDGVFVQIGLSANSAPFADAVERTPQGEIVVDAHCRTTVKGVYAAGDVTTVPYKQIMISMGEGAKAALSAFEDRIRGIIG